MILKNLTTKIQKIELVEITGEDRIYDTYLEPLSSTKIEGPFLVLNLQSLRGLVEIEGVEMQCECNTEDIFSPVEEIVEDTPVEALNISENINSEEVHTSEGFICDICGAEFGSARGLTSHKSRVHSENN